MLRIKVLGLFSMIMIIFFCQQSGSSQNKSIVLDAETQDYPQQVSELEADFMKWWTYHQSTMQFSTDFVGLDEQLDTITKRQFLEQLIIGDFISVKLTSEGTIPQYGLSRLSPNADRSIRTTIKSDAMTHLAHYNKEGTLFPDFEFTDLNGLKYTNATMRGSTFIVKTWFVACAACIAEFPELNEFVKSQEGRNDVVFLSLALNNEVELQKFLAKKEFSYPVVSSQQSFITEQLNLQIYPTHIIVDDSGVILKVVNKASEMIEYYYKHMK